jgi:prepilin-type N-terminal cleavage/methylation domain-containing protein
MKRRGFSLIETLVTMAVLTVALVLVGTLFQYGVRISTSAEGRNALQGERLKVARQIRRALADSYRSGNTAFYMANPGPQEDLVISIIAQDSWDPMNQEALFGGYHIYYREASDDTLRYLQHTITPDPVAAPLTEAEVRSVIGANPGVAILRALSVFQLYLPSDGSTGDVLTNPLGLRMTQQTTRDTPLTTEMTYKFVVP